MYYTTKICVLLCIVFCVVNGDAPARTVDKDGIDTITGTDCTTYAPGSATCWGSEIYLNYDDTEETTIFVGDRIVISGNIHIQTASFYVSRVSLDKKRDVKAAQQNKRGGDSAYCAIFPVTDGEVDPSSPVAVSDTQVLLPSTINQFAVVTCTFSTYNVAMQDGGVYLVGLANSNLFYDYVIGANTAGTTTRYLNGIFKPDSSTNVFAENDSSSTLVIYTMVANSAAGSDPIVTGFHGKEFDFKGVPNRVFNMFSLPDIQVSALFIETGAPGATYMGVVGITQGENTFISFDLDSAFVHQIENGEQVAVKKLKYPMDQVELPNSGKLNRPSRGTLVAEWPQYSIKMKRIFERPPGATEEFNYIDFTISMSAKPGPDDIHGVIGHTYFLTSNESVGYLGEWADYAAAEGESSVFTTNFPQVTYKFNPAKHTVLPTDSTVVTAEGKM